MIRHRSPATLLPLLCGALVAAADPVSKETRSTEGRPFVHPGIFYTQGDLDRMKAMVAAGREPWKRGFDALEAGRWSSFTAEAPRCPEKIPAEAFNQTLGIPGRFAHDNALLWRLTGDTAHADKARDFLVSNSYFVDTTDTGTIPLDNGKIFNLVEAAELLRDYPGWKAEDQERFRTMLRKVFAPKLCDGDIMRWGNQALMAWHAYLAMAIYLDDRKMYDRVWNNLVALPHRPDDKPYPTRCQKPEEPSVDNEYNVEHTGGARFDDTPDWGYDDQLRHYLYANGQCEESCRDQGHTMFGLFQMVCLAEIFWNQGDDLYGALDNRILRGVEWQLRYNTSDWEPAGFTDKEEAATFENNLFYRALTRNTRWTALKPSPQGRGADGGAGAPKTAVLMHYAIRAGLPKSTMPWTLKAVGRGLKDGGAESWGFGACWYYEYEGWGTLTKYRTPYQHGDPGTWKSGTRVSGAHVAPGAIRAVDFDFHPSTEAFRTEHVQKDDKRSVLAKIGDGDQMDYTLSVDKGGEYEVALVYRNYGALAVSVSADGGTPLARTLSKTQGWVRAPLGKITLAAGAPVLRLAVDRAHAAALLGIVIK